MRQPNARSWCSLLSCVWTYKLSADFETLLAMLLIVTSLLRNCCCTPASLFTLCYLSVGRPWSRSRCIVTASNPPAIAFRRKELDAGGSSIGGVECHDSVFGLRVLGHTESRCCPCVKFGATSFTVVVRSCRVMPVWSRDAQDTARSYRNSR